MWAVLGIDTRERLEESNLQPLGNELIQVTSRALRSSLPGWVAVRETEADRERRENFSSLASEVAGIDQMPKSMAPAAEEPKNWNREKIFQ